MSEIAKCPVCGDEPSILFDLFDKREEYPKGYSCCEVDDFLDELIRDRKCEWYGPIEPPAIL